MRRLRLGLELAAQAPSRLHSVLEAEVRLERPFRDLRLAPYGASDVHSLWQRVSGPAPSPAETVARLVIEPTHGGSLEHIIPLPCPEEES